MTHKDEEGEELIKSLRKSTFNDDYKPKTEKINAVKIQNAILIFIDDAQKQNKPNKSLFAVIQELLDTYYSPKMWKTLEDFCIHKYEERFKKQINARTLLLDFGGK